jgi:hypothetical protein
VRPAVGRIEESPQNAAGTRIVAAIEVAVGVMKSPGASNVPRRYEPGSYHSPGLVNLVTVFLPEPRLNAFSQRSNFEPATENLSCADN